MAAKFSMTRAHFEQIAARLRMLRPVEPDGDNSSRETGAYEQWNDTVRAFISMCQASNPGFDRERFEKACGY